MTVFNPADEVRDLIAREKWTDQDQPTLSGWLQRMCRTAVRELSASGVGVSLISEAGDLLTAAASDRISMAVEELQITLGQGPCRATYAAGREVLVPDLHAAGEEMWQGYAAAAREYGVRSVFAFPLQYGTARIGALDVYRSQTGELSELHTQRALTFADVAMRGLLDASERSGGMAALFTADTETRLEIYQAQGMVMVQLGVGAPEALSRMRAHAFATETRLFQIADDVIAGKLHLVRDSP